MSGAPSQLDMWDYKPKMNDWFDKDLPDSVRNGQRLTTMTSGQKRFPIAPSIFKFAAARQARRLGQRTAAAHRRHRRRSGRHQDGQHRGDQSRPGDHLHPNRQPAARPPQHGRLAVVRPGQHEREPAGVRRACIRRSTAASAGKRCTRGCGEPASCPRVIRASACAPPAIRCCICPIPPA